MIRESKPRGIPTVGNSPGKATSGYNPRIRFLLSVESIQCWPLYRTSATSYFRGLPTSACGLIMASNKSYAMFVAGDSGALAPESW